MESNLSILESRKILTNLGASALVLMVMQAAAPMFAFEARSTSATANSTSSVLIQGTDIETVTAAVEAVGGHVTHRLTLIDATAAELTQQQRAALTTAYPAWSLHANAAVETAAKGLEKNTESANEPTADYGSGNGDTSWDAYMNAAYTHYPGRIGADLLHSQGITGRGVTIAVLDSGIFGRAALSENTAGDLRVLAQYDAIGNKIWSPTFWQDRNGHGSHVIATAANSAANVDDGRYNGIAPDADVVLVRAFDRYGRATYADVIRGIDWIVSNREAYGIRILNLSMSAPVRSHYWDDPLNQAVMAAWHAGIVVVASAGNGGPDPMTVGVPGNVPYIITVGAMTDSFTANDETDDRLTFFSAAGPTAEAFVKPDVIAHGGQQRGQCR
ncbi:MAG: S8 family serine peptidase [Rhodothermales bacterium]|nr:S8 family serine peptidase [Rhodothermales bacterium]